MPEFINYFYFIVIFLLFLLFFFLFSLGPQLSQGLKAIEKRKVQNRLLGNHPAAHPVRTGVKSKKMANPTGKSYFLNFNEK